MENGHYLTMYKKGIEVLDNDTGFFMMCEGGKMTGHVMQMMPAQRIKQRIFIKMIKEYKFDEQE